MENQLVVKNNSGMPTEHEMMVYQTVSEQALSSKMYPNFKDKSGIMMIMLAARELGIPSMQALNGGLNIIQGKVEISARMMNALIRRAGHKIIVKECTDTECLLEGIRADTGESQTASFSVAEAQKAGLIKQGGGWTKFPKDMCFARALSRLARQLFSDVIGIGYVEGEISQAHEIKNPGNQSIIEDQTVEVKEFIKQDEVELFNKYLDFFDNEDKHLALEYLKVVEKHFDWTRSDCIEELMKDEVRLFEKFNHWKSKIKKREEK